MRFGPFASLDGPACRRQKGRVVVLSLREGRRLRHVGEERLRLVVLTDPGKGMRAQSCGALVVVFRIARDHLVEIGGGGPIVVQRQRAQGAAVERIDRVRHRDHAIETFARLRDLLVVEIQIAELFVVADRRIVDDQPFQGLDALAAREDLVGAVQEAGVGKDLDEDVGQRAEAAADQDDPEPEGVRPAAHEVQNRDGLQEDAVGIEEPEHSGARL